MLSEFFDTNINRRRVRLIATMSLRKVAVRALPSELQQSSISFQKQSVPNLRHPFRSLEKPIKNTFGVLVVVGGIEV
jgi:hypothetical protein